MPVSPTLAATRMKTEAGWLFSVSFRPFFIGAVLLAASAVPAWIWMYVAGFSDIAHLPTLQWHAHEMVFGFLPAVMAGYLLSATPNWSGKLPASGFPLAALFALWLAGRILPLALPFWPGAIVDTAFPLAMFLALAREARVKSAEQSRHGLILFPLLAAAALAHRILADDYEAAAMLARLGVGVGALLIAAVGGRLVPSFTRNAMAHMGCADRMPEPYGRFDIGVLMMASIALVSWIAAPIHPATAFTMLIAGLLHVIRLLRWRGWRLRDFSVIALHLGYGWLTLGTAFAGLAALPFALVPPDAALHALTAGAIGTMTLAVMGRLASTRGQGPRIGAGAIRLALLLVNAGALARVAAPMIPMAYLPLVTVSAGLWALSFALFALSQFWLLRPRIRT